MKFKALTILPLVGLFVLSSCGAEFYFYIERNPNGGHLIDITGEEVYERAITNNETLVVLIGESVGCSTCTTAIKNIGDYCALESVDIYFYEVSGVTEEDYTYLYDATIYMLGEDNYNALPAWGEELSTPYVYIFYEQTPFPVGTTDYIGYFRDHFILVDPS
ncbi:MAG: hypothetical protein LUC31_02500 [Coprobacillus sp.]|nr:hypothetical protein [Coprobacillus sp.]